MLKIFFHKLSFYSPVKKTSHLFYKYFCDCALSIYLQVLSLADAIVNIKAIVLGSRVGSGIQKRSTDENEAVSNNILSFFPLDKSSTREKKDYDGSQEEKFRTKETNKVGEMSSGGRVLETYTGEKVFIPALNIESICSATEASGDNFNKDGNLLHGKLTGFK